MKFVAGAQVDKSCPAFVRGLAFLLGVAVAANFAIVPGSAASPRLSDILGLVTFLLVLPFVRVRLRQLIFVLVGALFFALLTVQEYEWGAQTAVIPFRWCLAFLTIAIFFGRHEERWETVVQRILGGMLTGAFISVGLSILQIYGVDAGLTAADARFVTANGNPRATGLYEHPNANAHCVMLGVAAALHLALRPGARVRLYVGVFLALAVALYVTTGTRAILGIALTLLVVFFAKSRGLAPKAWLVLGTLTISLLGLTLYRDALVARMFGTGEADYFFYNILGRVETISAGLGFMAENPLGAGVIGQRVIWQDAFQTDAVHNGVIWGIVVFGWAFAVIAIAHLLAVWRFVRPGGDRESGPFGFVLLSAATSLLFEDLPGSPSFAIVMTIGAAAAFRVLKQSKSKTGRAIPHSGGKMA